MTTKLTTQGLEVEFAKTRLIQPLIQRLWDTYCAYVPQVATVQTALVAKKQAWVEDHIAFRTLPGQHTGLDVLVQLFELMGYTRQDHYTFTAKKLKAIWLAPPVSDDDDLSGVPPKIFISELEAEKLSPAARELIKSTTDTVRANPLDALTTLLQRVATQSGDKALDQSSVNDDCEQFVETAFQYLNGPLWPRPRICDYELLQRESEYASWTLMYGAIPNHFTLSVHLMRDFADFKAFVNFLIDDLKLELNGAGKANANLKDGDLASVIQGTPECLLEQCSTVAESRQLLCQDGIIDVPYAFVEFAYRHTHDGAQPNGRWGAYYQAFVANNADKIFESTNQRP